ncbi:MAG: phosphatase PAP2 family protein, partial [Clostridia bacterium]|nr:phosphatase PAP2 family protein [Clostridia bacterium]
AASVFFFNKKWGSVLLGVASVIAFSRLYLYVHYPTDVLGGIICGLLAAIAAYCITIRIKKDAKPKE